MTFLYNSKGEEFLIKVRKEINKYIIGTPIIVAFVTFLFILGAKNTLHLIFSIFLAFGFLFFIIVGFIILTRNVSRTISKVVLKDNQINILTFGTTIYKQKSYNISLIDVVITERQINILTLKNTPILELKFKNRRLILVKDFFDKELFEFLENR